MNLQHQVRASLILDDFFSPAPQRFRSFREAYVEITGDRKVSGKQNDCDAVRLREAISTSTFNDLFGAAVSRAMTAEYRDMEKKKSIWRRLARQGNATDFRSLERYMVGGYDGIYEVSEGADYGVLLSPDSRKVAYGVTKRGGLETITLESIKNDQVEMIREIPKRMAKAAYKTLSKFALDFIRANPNVYDGLPLFNITHQNLGNAALSASALNAARAAMMKQPEDDSGDPLGLKPRTLWVPLDLEETAVNLFRRAANKDKTFIQSLELEVVPVWYWTDANDWALSTAPDEYACMEISFMDGNTEPELFAQDNPSVGSLFSSDKLTYKIRHIYGGAVLDRSGLYKSVVA